MAATRRRSVTDAVAQRLNVRVSPEAYRRLHVHAVMGNTTPGKLIERLITANLKDWRIQSVQASRTGPVALDGSASPADGVNVAAPIGP